MSQPTTIEKQDIQIQKVPVVPVKSEREYTPEELEARMKAPLFDETDMPTEKDNSRDEFIYRTSLSPLVESHFKSLSKAPESKLQPSFDDTDVPTEVDNADLDMIYTSGMNDIVGSHFVAIENDTKLKSS